MTIVMSVDSNSVPTASFFTLIKQMTMKYLTIVSLLTKADSKYNAENKVAKELNEIVYRSYKEHEDEMILDYVFTNTIHVPYIIPLVLPDLSKHYYSIGEVAELIGEKTSLIRFYEKQLPIKIKRAEGQYRKYKATEVKRLIMIHYCIKEAGMRLEGIKKALEGKYLDELYTFHVANQENFNKVQL